MTGTDRVFSGSIAEIYDRLLVPLIFSSYADDLAKRVAQLKPQRVLETAAGTGVVTKALARKLPETASIVATDLNQAMLDRAASTTRDGRVVWQHADALKLPFEDESLDVVVCQFGVMFFPDKVQGFREARRVLKPGGQFLFSVWDDIVKNEFADAVTTAVANVFPQDPPLFLARTPHGYHDISTITQHLSAVEFSNVSVETVRGLARASSPQDPAIGFCQGTPLRSEIESRDASRLEEATQHAARAVERRFGSGPVEGSMSAHVVTARR
jgi:ubiquinone/menaquinone biosynthesis C-methylase UbiE